MTEARAAPPAALGQAAPKSLILNLYGAHVRDLGGWLAVSHLLVLMGELGHEPRAVRAAVSRMKRSSLLAAATRHGVAGYALTTSAAEILRDGDARIFHSAEPPRLSDGWVVAVFSVPEEARERRHRLRSHLLRLGFGQVSPGVWIAPRRMHGEVTRLLERSDLTQHTTLFAGEYLGFAELRAVVERTWDLAGLEARYRGFLAAQRAGAAAANGRSQKADRRAFVRYMSLLSGWRTLAYSDPGLPTELLPARWYGRTAARRFMELRRQLEGRAQSHVRAVTAA